MKRKKKAVKKKDLKKFPRVPQSTMVPPWLKDVGFSVVKKDNGPADGNQVKAASAPAPQQSPAEKTRDELDSLLVDFFYGSAWVAYKAFVDQQAKLAESVLRTIDIFKEPTNAARNQGRLEAIGELQDYIKQVIDERAKKNEGTSV